MLLGGTRLSVRVVISVPHRNETEDAETTPDFGYPTSRTSKAHKPTKNMALRLTVMDNLS